MPLKSMLILGCCLLWSTLGWAETRLRIVVGNWEPYIGQNLPDQGMAAVILRESFANAGYDVELDFLPWKRALSETAEGLYDATYLWADREERREKFLFSVPVIVTTNVFFYRKDSDFDWRSYEDLTRFNIGSVLGYQYAPDWQQAVDDRVFYPIMINSDRIGFDMLRVGRLDAFPASYLVGKDILQTDFDEQERQLIGVHERKIVVHGLHLLISKSLPEGKQVVTDFNRGYSELAQAGRFREIALRYLSMDKNERTDTVLPE